jgi:hypothetical protein
MPKCGSSSLQAYLSSDHFKAVSKSNKLAYAVINEMGYLIIGDELCLKAKQLPFQYLTSASGANISKFSDDIKKSLIKKIQSLEAYFDTLIFSNEGWGQNPHHFYSQNLFDHPSLNVTFLAYVRPQVEWLNSAWWQWGAWTDAPLRKWIRVNRMKARWYDTISKWSEKDWVRKIDIRIFNDDIVGDICSYLKIVDNSQPVYLNYGLPEIVLRIFQRNRVLRPGPHDSMVDFILREHLDLSNNLGTPWVLRENIVKSLVDYYVEDNKSLSGLLSFAQQETMLNDTRWWSHLQYPATAKSSNVMKSMRHKDLEPLLVSALNAIVALDAKLRNQKIQG